MGYKTKIDWCDATWNPVTGCLHGCEYCYARKIAKRFEGAVIAVANEEGYAEYSGTTYADGTLHDLLEPIVDYGKTGKAAPYPFGFDPTFHRYKLDEPARWKKPRTIFVCSMADLFGDWVPDEWIQQVFDACEAAPWHRYIFLTKNPQRLNRMAKAHYIRVIKGGFEIPDDIKDWIPEDESVLPLPVRENWWFGSTTDRSEASLFRGGWKWNTFASIEPLREHMHTGLASFGGIRWVVIGAETGNRLGKVIPKREWIENIVETADTAGVKVFMKESLREIMGDDFRQEVPWEV